MSDTAAATPVANTIVSGAFDGAAKLLGFGALGVAGILLVGCILVYLVSIIWKRNLTPDILGSVNRFMVVGTICFVAALGVQTVLFFWTAAHNVTLILYPDKTYQNVNLDVPTIQVSNGYKATYNEAIPIASDVFVYVNMQSVYDDFLRLQAAASASDTKARSAQTALLNSYDYLGTLQARWNPLAKNLVDFKTTVIGWQGDAKCPAVISSDATTKVNYLDALAKNASAAMLPYKPNASASEVEALFLKPGGSSIFNYDGKSGIDFKNLDWSNLDWKAMTAGQDIQIFNPKAFDSGAPSVVPKAAP